MSSASALADRGSASAPQGDAGDVRGNSPEVEEVDGGGGYGGDDQDSQEVQLVEGGKGKSVPIIQPAVVFTKLGDVFEVEQKIADAVDEFIVPAGCRRKGSREQSFMYSLGVYVEQDEGIDHKYFCMACAQCRASKRVVPCKNGDRSNVNTHLKTKHALQGTAGLKKDVRKKTEQQGIIVFCGSNIYQRVSVNTRMRYVHGICVRLD